MTTTRDHQSETEAKAASVPWDMRPIYGPKAGFPWWVAIALALGLTIVDIILGWQIAIKPAFLFSPLYFLGCVAAICLVQRRSVFGPMVQPPLIFGITVPALMMLGLGKAGGNGGSVDVWSIAQPLINGFPTMALTTGITVVIGVIRITRERNPQPRKKKPAERKASADSRPRPPASSAQRPEKPTAAKTPSKTRKPSSDRSEKQPPRERQRSGEFPVRNLPRERGVPPRQSAGEQQARNPVRRPAPPADAPRKPAGGGQPPRVARPWEQ